MTVSEFSQGRSAAGSSDKSRLLTAAPNLIKRVRSSLGKLVSFAFLRVLVIFLVGFAAGVAWQSYGGEIRKAIAGWSPHLAWVAPAPSSVPASSGGSAERLKATSVALTTARQSLDKLATEISKLQPQDAEAPRRRAAR
jgi:hypothetical protein